jgi:hypothetical protein
VPEDETETQYNAIVKETNEQIRALTEGGEQHA